MKRLLSLFFLIAWLAGPALAQLPTEQTPATPTPEGPAQPITYGLGDGLQMSVNEGDYRFKISGFLQPSYRFYKQGSNAVDTYLRTKRSYLNFSADAVKERLTIFVQADFSAATPLLDAYAAWHFIPGWDLSVGQRRTFTNNREMTFNEDKLQFPDRSVLSTTFQGNGREFGAFLSGTIGKGFVIVPQLAVTSGDGPNSFGATSQDVDLGKLKYGGRLDIYPLGQFSEGNRGFAADLKHETTPKLLIGVAGSYNQGVSNALGEGHGDFLLYDKSKKQHLPDLHKVSADILFKFAGYSIMAEFMNASAAGLSRTYLDSSASMAMLLRPGQISNYLVLGNAFTLTAGYAFKSGFSIDARYEMLKPEFDKETGSLLAQAKVNTVGLSRYFRENKLKLQASFSHIDYARMPDANQGEIVFQVVF